MASMNAGGISFSVEYRHHLGPRMDDIHGEIILRGFLDHAFMLHCTIVPHLLAQRGVCLQRARSLAAINVTLLILVKKIPLNFQFDMQFAGNANSNVSFQVNASFEQTLFITMAGLWVLI